MEDRLERHQSCRSNVVSANFSRKLRLFSLFLAFSRDLAIGQSDKEKLHLIGKFQEDKREMCAESRNLVPYLGSLCQVVNKESRKKREKMGKRTFECANVMISSSYHQTYSQCVHCNQLTNQSCFNHRQPRHNLKY